jgi:hypothetical protein
MGVNLGAVVLQWCGAWQSRRRLTWVGVDGRVADCVAVTAAVPLTDPLGDGTALTEDDEDGEVDRDAAAAPLADRDAVLLPDALAETMPLRDGEPLPLGDPLCEGVHDSEVDALPLPLPEGLLLAVALTLLLPLAVALTLPLLLAVPVTLPVCEIVPVTVPVCDGVAD